MPLFGKEVSAGNFRVIADWVFNGGTATLSAFRGCCCGGGGGPVDECASRFHCGNLSTVRVSRVRYRSCQCYHNHCRMTPYVAFSEGYAMAEACDASVNICHNGLQASQTITWAVPGSTAWQTLNEVPTAQTQTSNTCSNGTTRVSSSVLSRVDAYCTGKGYIKLGNLSSCACNQGAYAAIGVTIQVSAGSGRKVIVCIGGTSYTVSSGTSRTIGEAVFNLAGGAINIPFAIF
jgi:hypothetical protein